MNTPEILPDNLERLRELLADKLEEARKLFKFPEQRRLTILVRQPGEPERDCVVTDDTPEGIAEIISRRTPAAPSSAPAPQEAEAAPFGWYTQNSWGDAQLHIGAENPTGTLSGTWNPLYRSPTSAGIKGAHEAAAKEIADSLLLEDWFGRDENSARLCDEFAADLVPVLLKHFPAQGLIPEWRPIESAPKDGTHLWLYEGDTSKKMWRGYWGAEGADAWVCAAGSDDHTVCWMMRINPTHWMPLPKTPSQEGETAPAPISHDAALAALDVQQIAREIAGKTYPLYTDEWQEKIVAIIRRHLTGPTAPNPYKAAVEKAAYEMAYGLYEEAKKTLDAACNGKLDSPAHAPVDVEALVDAIHRKLFPRADSIHRMANSRKIIADLVRAHLEGHHAG